jgi:hypothetical protein
VRGRRVSGIKIAGALAAAVILYFALGALLHCVVFPEAELPAWAYASPGFAFETPTGERFELIRGASETGGAAQRAPIDE